MKYVLEIPMKLPSLNTYIQECRHNKYMGAKTKRRYEEEIEIYIMQQLRGVHIEKPVEIYFTWFEKDKRRDLDNIYSAKKFILDALVGVRVLKDDSQKYVVDLYDRHDLAEEYKVVVEIEETDKKRMAIFETKHE